MLRTTAVALSYLLASVALTWPLAAPGGRLVTLHPDALSGLWNHWWMARAVLDLGVSPWWTDFLHHPDGLSLARHALSPANALLGGLLSRWIGLPASFHAMLLLHFWLSGLLFYAFAREISRSERGSFLAGLAWTFSPFHYFYLPQLNLVTLEVLPLAALFAVRSYRHGGAANALGLAGAAALLAATCYYYLVYAALLGGLLGAAGRLWAPEVPARRGVPRLLLAGAAEACAATLVAYPLVSEVLGGSPAAERSGAVLQHHRANDLLGFSWVALPERTTVSWPTMLGWVNLLLAAAALRVGRRALFWWLGALLFLTLSLGPVLRIAGRDTGIPLPYALLEHVPLLSMLRKPDRLFVMVQLCIAVLAALGWREGTRRVTRPSGRWALFAGVAALLLLERHAVPLQTFALEVSPYWAELARDESVRTLVGLPVFGGNTADARENHLQTLHGKKIPQGYVTSFALPPDHREEAARWARAYSRLPRSGAGSLLRQALARDIDLLVLHKVIPVFREPVALDETIWQPFARVARLLVGLRQRGHLRDQRLAEDTVAVRRAALRAALGPPVFEDDSIVVFRRGRSSRFPFLENRLGRSHHF